MYWSPTAVQPTACLLALWWLKFGPTEGEVGGGGKEGNGGGGMRGCWVYPGSLPRLQVRGGGWRGEAEGVGSRRCIHKAVHTQGGAHKAVCGHRMSHVI